MADLVMSIFLLPTLYVWIARERDVLPPASPASPKANTSTSPSPM